MTSDRTTSDTPSDSASLAKIAGALERVIAGFKAETADRARERKVMTAVLALGFTAVLSVQGCLAKRSYANATRIAEIAAAQEEQRADLRTLVDTTEQTQETVEEAKAEVAAAPRLEVAPPVKPGGPAQVKLVVPARPAKAATSATPSATAVPSSAPAPAVSIPLTIPATTTGGAP